MKVTIDWKAVLRVVFIFQRNNPLKLFLCDRIEIFPEFIYELYHNFGHATKVSLDLAHRLDINSTL